MTHRRFLAALAVFVTLGTQGAAQAPSGAYLAAQHARTQGDFAAAAQYYAQVLTRDPGNVEVLESAAFAYMALGQVDRAAAVARKMEAEGAQSQVAQIPLIVEAAQDEDWAGLLTRIEAGRGAGELADGMIAAWAELGHGDMSAALERIDALAEEQGLRNFALYHKALALAVVGDFEAADRVFSGESDGQVQRTRSGVVAWAQVLSQLGETDRALSVLEDTFGSTPAPEIANLRARLEAGETVPFTMVEGPRDGVAEVFFSLARALMQEANDEFVLIYARAAEAIDPDHVYATITAAETLQSMEQYKLAIDAFASVPRDHPAFHTAELGRAEALRTTGKPDAAAEVLAQLAGHLPEIVDIHVAAGDLHREQEEYEEAIAAYDRAVTLLEERDNPQWFVYYVRAIAHERLDNWPEAEADFRRALDLNPDHPQVLNYLGYTMVEKGVNLDEALDMIERAVAARPDSGYIVDSLGWVLYRLGRYDEAIGHMERAAELMPTDPVVNDHLGDVLWAVERKTEARFQWRRALSLHETTPSPDLGPERVRRKLEVGLDKVLHDEGAEPLRMVDDGG
ncbi:tetratricopeptide repeat protein [Roseovarius nitratireducens]|uniref:tetratricopeptide repeat protein n=1 Tax=Roseovarius nitratireducens TaxID=2044597 RepID=UPI001F0CA0AF|nr:tetratricopeptide repeat protein [Roseovarius nitratireducens]